MIDEIGTEFKIEVEVVVGVGERLHKQEKGREGDCSQEMAKG